MNKIIDIENTNVFFQMKNLVFCGCGISNWGIEKVEDELKYEIYCRHCGLLMTEEQYNVAKNAYKEKLSSKPCDIVLVDDSSKLKQVDKRIKTGLIQEFGIALIAICDLFTSGEEKYECGSWKKLINGIESYNDALISHILKENFQEIDPDMEQKHSVSIAWNSLAKLTLEIEADPVWKARLLKRERKL